MSEILAVLVVAPLVLLGIFGLMALSLFGPFYVACLVGEILDRLTRALRSSQKKDESFR